MTLTKRVITLETKAKKHDKELIDHSTRLLAQEKLQEEDEDFKSQIYEIATTAKTVRSVFIWTGKTFWFFIKYIIPAGVLISAFLHGESLLELLKQLTNP